MGRWAWVAVCISLLFIPCHYAAAASEPVAHVRLDRSATAYDLHDDLTYSETIEVDQTLLTPRGLSESERAVQSFYPDSQSLDLVEAWVVQPDGARVEATPANTFTRPSAAAQGAPGFSGSLTTTVLFPQLRPGSRTHVKWRLVQKTPPLLGFNVWDEAAFEMATIEDAVDITAPESVALTWTQRGGYTVSDERASGRRHIHAEMNHTSGQAREPNMVSTSDFQPLFLATSLSGWEEIGAIYNRQSRDRIVVTPEIAALAENIAAHAEGLDAARLVYDWVATNIRYVAVFLDPNDGYVPHAADAVLRAGYGDCKDHVALMQALLAARGIEAQAALVDWGGRTRDLPLVNPGQFNHAFVYLPQYDVYANPTNPYATFGALDRRLADKITVLATETGRVARTPRSRPEANRYSVESRVRVEPDGTLDGAARFTTASNLDSAIRGAMAASASPRDLAERLLNNTAEGGFGEFHTSNPRDLESAFDIVATWTSPHGITFQGRDAYVPMPTGPDLRPPHSMRAFFTSSGERKLAMMVGAGDYSWSTTLLLPADVSVISLPPDLALHNDAGSFTASYERIDGGLRVSRHLTVERDVYAAADYANLTALLYAPIEDARAVAVLERGEQAVAVR